MDAYVSIEGIKEYVTYFKLGVAYFKLGHRYIES